MIGFLTFIQFILMLITAFFIGAAIYHPERHTKGWNWLYVIHISGGILLIAILEWSKKL